jgi:hypothetical protein
MGIANIVPLKVLEKIWRITYNSHRGMNTGHFVIHMDAGNIKIHNNKKGMPYLNLKRLMQKLLYHLSKSSAIRQNMEGFTKQEVKEAEGLRGRRRPWVGTPRTVTFWEWYM